MSYLRKRKDRFKKAEDIVCSVSNNGLCDNHSIAYCLLGYLCAYYRFYYPLEFITSFLNNAANEDDIKNGTAYAEKVGIRVTMPRWGTSKSGYFYDKERRTIAKGLTSIKYMSDGLAEDLYDLAHNKKYYHFVDLLYDIDKETSINTRQLDILIKIDFFVEFGNQRELMRIYDLFHNMLRDGNAKLLKKDKIDGTLYEPFVKKYSNDKTKSGEVSKSYTLLDTRALLCDLEDSIKSVHMDDLDNKIKIVNFYDLMGYYGYSSGKEEDRKKLYVIDMFPLRRKRDGVKFGYSIITKSIGSGKESRFTIFNRLYNTDPIHKGDIIYCDGYTREGQYFTLTSFHKDW